jgi:hypothetical protein
VNACFCHPDRAERKRATRDQRAAIAWTAEQKESLRVVPSAAPQDDKELPAHLVNLPQLCFAVCSDLLVPLLGEGKRQSMTREQIHGVYLP